LAQAAQTRRDDSGVLYSTERFEKQAVEFNWLAPLEVDQA
jgi:hypothetical protein